MNVNKKMSYFAFKSENMNLNKKYVSGKAKYAGFCEYTSPVNIDFTCPKKAFYNLPGQARGAFCTKHRDEETMVDVRSGQGAQVEVEHVEDEREEEFGKIVWLVEPYRLVDY
jgi:hypothetical protein